MLQQRERERNPLNEDMFDKRKKHLRMGVLVVEREGGGRERDPLNEDIFDKRKKHYEWEYRWLRERERDPLNEDMWLMLKVVMAATLVTQLQLWGSFCIRTAHFHVVGGDVAVYVFDINQPNLPTPFYSFLVSVSVFMALSNVFHSINFPDNSPLSYSISALLVLSTIYIYISL